MYFAVLLLLHLLLITAIITSTGTHKQLLNRVFYGGFGYDTERNKYIKKNTKGIQRTHYRFNN
jgi:hypothetical protein